MPKPTEANEPELSDRQRSAKTLAGIDNLMRQSKSWLLVPFSDAHSDLCRKRLDRAADLLRGWMEIVESSRRRP